MIVGGIGIVKEKLTMLIESEIPGSDTQRRLEANEGRYFGLIYYAAVRAFGTEAEYRILLLPVHLLF